MKTRELHQSVNTDYDIMIVGGGPAGISTWLHLHKFSPYLASKSILIEKEIYPRDKLCGGAIAKLGQDILKKLEVDIDIPSVSIHNTEYRSKKDVLCHNERDFLKIARRIEFDHALAKSAIKRGLQLNQDEMFLDISRKNDLVVKTNKGRYKVKVLIGADGALSKIRNKMNQSIKPRFASAIEIFAPVNHQYDQEFSSNTAVIDFSFINEGLQGYVWHFPCIKDGEISMNHGICDTHMNVEKPRADMKKIFNRELHKRKIDREPSSWLGHPVPWFSEDPILSQSNILLVGDAAGIEPLIGGGIHLSLAYGEVSALTILDAFRHNEFSFKDYKDRVRSHIVGKYIRKLTNIASEIYNDNLDVLDGIKKILPKY